jgi:hypothetical protein
VQQTNELTAYRRWVQQWRWAQGWHHQLLVQGFWFETIVCLCGTLHIVCHTQKTSTDKWTHIGDGIRDGTIRDGAINF